MNAEVCNKIVDLPDQFIGTPGIDLQRRSRLEPDGFEPKPGTCFGHILVATDFSRSATAAVRLAANLASLSHATLTVLHVVDTNPDSATAHSGSADDLMDAAWQKALSEMVRLKEQLAAAQNVPTETLIVEGIPWEQIAMQSKGFDLLVLGHKSLRSWNFFSKHTSRRLLKEAGCPVLTA